MVAEWKMEERKRVRNDVQMSDENWRGGGAFKFLVCNVLRSSNLLDIQLERETEQERSDRKK